MAIIVNTNMSALRTQKNLTNATNDLNTALNRMSTGLKINCAADDAAGLYVASGLNTQIRGSKVAQKNVATGINVLQIVEGDMGVIEDNLLRIRDLATQAANGIYSEDAMKAMKGEVEARVAEINRVSDASNFNGLKLLAGEGELGTNGLRLQVGANSSETENCIRVSKDVFANAKASILGLLSNGGGKFASIGEAFATASAAAQFIHDVDTALNKILNHKSTIGSIQNRLESASNSLVTLVENSTAAKSTIMDADIAEESANYTKAQILQQTSAALLVQANALPQIALNLIQ